MTERSPAVLVYNRIDENRRNTFILLAVFLALLLPLAGGIAQYLTPHSIFWTARLGNRVHNVESGSAEIHDELLTAAMLLVAIAVAVVVVAISLSTLLLLRNVGARRIHRADHLDLWRTVQNLCIGAGLPMPTLYLVESNVANAFAMGRDPEHASLVITTGLSSLLGRRELTAVIAHELSHIGNRDTRLNIVLAALLVTLRWPWNVAVWSIGRSEQSSLGDRLAMAYVMFPTVISGVGILVSIGLAVFTADVSPALRIWRLLGVLMPVYTLFGVPFLATGVRRMISREREFLADADAVLLTRDPEGLALALAKVGRAGRGVRAGVATAHMYFVDPLPAPTSWWDSIYQLHPPIDERIHRLRTMSDGIPQADLDAAEKVGRDYGERLEAEEWQKRLRVELQDSEPAPGKPVAVQLVSSDAPSDTKFRLTHDETPLYEKPDGWSHILQQLPQGTIVTFDGLEGDFVRVTTAKGIGYIAQGTLAEKLDAGANPARLPHIEIVREQANSASQDANDREGSLIPLYERPDGWSRVLTHVPHDAMLNSFTVEGNFVRVTTADNTVGYVARTAGLAALQALRGPGPT